MSLLVEFLDAQLMIGGVPILWREIVGNVFKRGVEFCTAADLINGFESGGGHHPGPWVGWDAVNFPLL